MYRGLLILSWTYRILALLLALLTPVFALISARMSETLARLAAERGIVAEAYNPFPTLLAGLFIALALYTAGALLALLVDMAIAQRETADALARIRRR